MIHRLLSVLLLACSASALAQPAPAPAFLTSPPGTTVSG